MDLKLTREAIPASETIFDGVQEQSVELDYILPDYYPDIFRLVRCSIEPVITDWSVSGGRLTYELRCDIRILYCGGPDQTVRCVTQQQTFTRTAELGSACNDPDIRLSPGTDRLSFRAVNKRRLDIRGAVSVRINASCTRTQEVISGGSGMNIQLRRIPLKFAGTKLNASRSVQLSGETSLPETQPEALSVLLGKCTPGECGLKLVSGKLLAKGEAEVRLLYSYEKDGSPGMETLSFTIPYSQIMELEGADESCICTVDAETVSCELSPSPDRNGQNRLIQYQLELRLTCTAVKPSSAMTVVDAYSTVYDTELETAEIRAELLPETFRSQFRHSARLAEGESVPEHICTVWCSPGNINTRLSPDGSSAVITGMLTYSMAASDSSGMTVMPDRDEPFEETVALDTVLPDTASVSSRVTSVGVSWSISPEGVLTADADLSVTVSAGGTRTVKAVTGIETGSPKEHSEDYAVKLYFGSEGEEVWDIARRCCTSVDAVMEENDLASDRLSGSGMLLIPIKE